MGNWRRPRSGRKKKTAVPKEIVLCGGAAAFIPENQSLATRTVELEVDQLVPIVWVLFTRMKLCVADNHTLRGTRRYHRLAAIDIEVWVVQSDQVAPAPVNVNAIGAAGGRGSRSRIWRGDIRIP